MMDNVWWPESNNFPREYEASEPIINNKENLITALQNLPSIKNGIKNGTKIGELIQGYHTLILNNTNFNDNSDPVFKAYLDTLDVIIKNRPIYEVALASFLYLANATWDYSKYNECVQNFFSWNHWDAEKALWVHTDLRNQVLLSQKSNKQQQNAINELLASRITPEDERFPKIKWIEYYDTLVWVWNPSEQFMVLSWHYDRAVNKLRLLIPTDWVSNALVTLFDNTVEKWWVLFAKLRKEIAKVYWIVWDSLDSTYQAGHISFGERKVNLWETVQEIIKLLYDSVEGRRTNHVTKADKVIDAYGTKQTNKSKAYDSVTESWILFALPSYENDGKLRGSEENIWNSLIEWFDQWSHIKAFHENLIRATFTEWNWLIKKLKRLKSWDKQAAHQKLKTLEDVKNIEEEVGKLLNLLKYLKEYGIYNINEAKEKVIEVFWNDTLYTQYYDALKSSVVDSLTKEMTQNESLNSLWSEYKSIVYNRLVAIHGEGNSVIRLVNNELDDFLALYKKWINKESLKRLIKLFINQAFDDTHTSIDIDDLHWRILSWWLEPEFRTYTRDYKVLWNVDGLWVTNITKEIAPCEYMNGIINTATNASKKAATWSENSRFKLLRSELWNQEVWLDSTIDVELHWSYTVNHTVDGCDISISKNKIFTNLEIEIPEDYSLSWSSSWLTRRGSEKTLNLFIASDKLEEEMFAQILWIEWLNYATKIKICTRMMKTELLMFMNKFPQLNWEYYGRSNQIVRTSMTNLTCFENGEHVFDFEQFDTWLKIELDTWPTTLTNAKIYAMMNMYRRMTKLMQQKYTSIKKNMNSYEFLSLPERASWFYNEWISYVDTVPTVKEVTQWIITVFENLKEWKSKNWEIKMVGTGDSIVMLPLNIDVWSGKLPWYIEIENLWWGIKNVIIWGKLLELQTFPAHALPPHLADIPWFAIYKIVWHTPKDISKKNTNTSLRPVMQKQNWLDQQLAVHTSIMKILNARRYEHTKVKKRQTTFVFQVNGGVYEESVDAEWKLKLYRLTDQHWSWLLDVSQVFQNQLEYINTSDINNSWRVKYLEKKVIEIQGKSWWVFSQWTPHAYSRRDRNKKVYGSSTIHDAPHGTQRVEQNINLLYNLPDSIKILYAKKVDYAK